METYEVRQLPVWPEIEQSRAESRGSRRKFWISIEGEPSLWLLKFARPNTGEHWAEKIAAEIGNLIGVDCARVELADCGGELVTVCESFDPENLYELYEFVSEQSDWLEGEQIVVGDLDWANHVNPPSFQETIFLAGCDVLAWSKEQYDVEARFGQREHNVDTIVQAVKEVFQDISDPRVAQVGDILQALASYALLDGLIGNTDRHHENWMLQIAFKDDVGRMSAAPSFDHASSLGRELRDDRRRERMNSGSVLPYLRRGRGGVYHDVDDRHAPAPLTLAQMLCQKWPQYTMRTLERIGAVDDAELWAAVDRVPTELMSETAKDFAYEVMLVSRTELLESAR